MRGAAQRPLARLVQAAIALAATAACKQPGSSTPAPGPAAATDNGGGSPSGGADPAGTVPAGQPAPPVNTSLGTGSPNLMPATAGGGSSPGTATSTASGSPTSGLSGVGGTGHAVAGTGGVIVNIGNGPGALSMPGLTVATLPGGLGTPQPSAPASSGPCSPGAGVGTCPPVNTALLAPLTASGLTGTVGQNVAWVLVGLDRNSLNPDQKSSARHVLVLVYNLPPGASTLPPQVTGQLSTAVTINWLPAQPTAGSFSLILRDYDRCVAADNAAACGQFAYMAPFDTRLDGLPYNIAAASTSNGSGSSGGLLGTLLNNGLLDNSLLDNGLRGLLSSFGGPPAATP